MASPVSTSRRSRRVFRVHRLEARSHRSSFPFSSSRKSPRLYSDEEGQIFRDNGWELFCSDDFTLNTLCFKKIFFKNFLGTLFIKNKSILLFLSNKLLRSILLNRTLPEILLRKKFKSTTYETFLLWSVHNNSQFGVI